MKKNKYTAPALLITKVNAVKMISTSGPELSLDATADQDAGMDVKVATPNNFNVWDDDWSE